MDNVLLTSSREHQLEQALTLLERFKQHEDQESYKDNGFVRR